MGYHKDISIKADDVEQHMSLNELITAVKNGEDVDDVSLRCAVASLAIHEFMASRLLGSSHGLIKDDDCTPQEARSAAYEFIKNRNEHFNRSIKTIADPVDVLTKMGY